MADPVARSPIAPAPPVRVLEGWEVSGRRSRADLTLVDCTPLAKVLIRAPEDGATAARLGVGFGRATREDDGTLVIGSGPGEWLLLGPVGAAPRLLARAEALAGDEFVSVADLTSSRALVRLTGARAADLLAKVCAIDLSDRATPDGSAFRTSVARLVTDVVRDDRGGVRSYLLHCERSSGQSLFDALLDAGAEFGVDVDGFTAASGQSA